MTAFELIDELESKPPRPLYFLWGEESFIRAEMIRRLTDLLTTPDNRDFNLENFDAKTDPLQTWLGAARTISFLGDQKLVVVRNLEELYRNEENSPSDADIKQLLKYAANPIPETCLVMTAAKADRKRKLFKALTKVDGAGECVAPKDPVLINWLKDRAQAEGYSLTRDAAQMMLDRVGAKPGLLSGELAKVLTYSGKTKSIKAGQVAEVVGDAKPEKRFALANALKSKNTEQAIAILRGHLHRGEEPLKVLGSIAWQYRMIWEVKHYQSKKLPRHQIAERMGAAPFAVEQAMQYTKNFSVDDLKKGMHSLFQADRELKTTGKSGEGILESLILKLCSAGH